MFQKAKGFYTTRSLALAGAIEGRSERNRFCFPASAGNTNCFAFLRALRGSAVKKPFLTTRSLMLARATENTEKFKISSFSFTGVLSKR